MVMKKIIKLIEWKIKLLILIKNKLGKIIMLEKQFKESGVLKEQAESDDK
tara:strand:- start:348 stop:497 length:150 start_codon:yes stop_codon:yes gene_type:complete